MSSSFGPASFLKVVRSPNLSCPYGIVVFLIFPEMNNLTVDRFGPYSICPERNENDRYPRKPSKFRDDGVFRNGSWVRSIGSRPVAQRYRLQNGILVGPSIFRNIIHRINRTTRDFPNSIYRSPTPFSIRQNKKRHQLIGRANIEFRN